MADRLFRLPCPPILDALRARHHAVIEASAGTGKTFTLEHLFIDLLLGDGVRPPLGTSEILLVTFTEKAAREIKSRCRALLTRIIELAKTPMSDGSAPDASDACPGHCACASPGEPCPCHLDERRCWTLDGQSIARFERALLEFDSVNISTIHAFCLRTLQEEAFQRGALFREELTDADALFDRVFRRCLRREFALGDCRWALERWLQAGRSLLGGQSDIPNQKQSLDAILRKVVRGGGVPRQSKQMLCVEARRGLLDELCRRLSALEEELLAAASDDDSSPNRVDVASLCSAFASLAKVIGPGAGVDLQSPELAWFNRYFYGGLFLEGFPDGLWPEDALLRRLPRLDAVAEVRALLKKRLDAPIEEDRRAEILAAVRCVERFLQCLPMSLESCVAAALTPPLVAALAEEKRDKGLIDYDDMLVRLDEALADPERGVPLRENLRRRYRAILIDEFQDTDEVQWRVFQALAGPFDRVDPLTTPRLVLIGDPKQSIYRFRGADLPTYVEARAALCGDGGAIRLATNFRTSPSLVSALNQIFDPEPLSAVEASGETAPRDAFEAAAVQSFNCAVITCPPAEEIAALPNDAPIVTRRADAAFSPAVEVAPSLVESREGFEPGEPSACFLRHANYGGSPRVEAGNRRARAVEKGQEASPIGLFELEVTAANGKTTVSEATYFAAHARLIAAEIARLCDPATGFLFDSGKGEAGLRPLRLSDVFVLVRDSQAMLGALRRALEERGLAYSVQCESVFESDEARDLLDLLRAIDRPMDRALRRRAALTRFLGFTPATLANLDDDALAHTLLEWRTISESGDLARLLERVFAQSGLMRRHLFASRHRAFANEIHLVETLLAQIGGRRLQIGELCALLDGLVHRRRDDRDESDERLRALDPPSLGLGAGDMPGAMTGAVQIMTMHAAKGLEAPVVFLMDRLNGRDKERVSVRPSRVGVPRSVFVDEVPMAAVESGAAERLDGDLAQELRLEGAADAERLLYVAMTRAMVRLYLPRVRVQEAARTAKLRLSGYWRLNERLCRLRPVAPPDVGLADNATNDAPRRGQPAIQADALTRLSRALKVASTPTAHGPSPLALTSYSQLAHGSARAGVSRSLVSTGEAALAAGAIALEDDGDHLSREEREAGEGPEADVFQDQDAGALPGGTATGNLVHALFEKVPFARVREARCDEALLGDDVFARVLKHEQTASGLNLSDAQRLNAARLVRATLTAPLELDRDLDPCAAPIRLVDLERPAVPEMEFLFPLPERAHPLLAANRHTAPSRATDSRARPPAFCAERGFVKGFIDLVFEHRGRLWLADWKTDRLSDAHPETLRRHVESHYAIQVRLYALALARLAAIETESAFARRFGGFLYFFVRQTDGASMRGVHLIRPTFADLARWESELVQMPLPDRMGRRS
ncbi:MAG: UvrD-helicase domain-containing protein [Myxococcaceae bacterium]|nr:UvrD-helicase domain-containing protein [Myxococcaceae bacterium]